MSVTKMGSIREAFLWQATEIRSAIRDAEFADSLRLARNLVELAAPAWLATGQEFATDLVCSMKAAVVQRARDLIAEEREFLSGERANSRRRGFSDTQIRELTDIIGTMT